MLTRRELLKTIGFIPLSLPLITLMVNTGGWTKTLAKGDPFGNARKVLLSRGFDRKYVDTLLSDPRLKLYPVIRKVMERPSESLPYDKYRLVMAVEQKIRDGKGFMHKYADELAQAERKYGVDDHYIAAIIGVESDYTRNPGTYNPVGVFVTMIEKIPGKRTFGEREIVELVRFCQRYDIDPHSLKGSYSGAIGIAQFMPSLLNKLYEDADGDGKPNPTTLSDAIHSVANYLRNYRGYGSGWTLGAKPSPGNKNWPRLG